jgi:hypothetical protein
MLVAAWSAAALFVAVHRPQEPLSRIIVAVALAGGVAALADAFVGDPASSTSTQDIASAVVSTAVALLFAIGLHLVLGLPDGALENRARRGFVIAGYVAALGLAAYLYSQRPDVPLGALTVAAESRGSSASWAMSVGAAGPAPHRRVLDCSGSHGASWSRPRSRSAPSSSMRCCRGRNRSPRSR